MRCMKCGNDFPEKDIHESHDVPCFMFPGKNRKERKQLADKEGRHHLCQKCHDIYEKMVFAYMIQDIPEQQRFAMIQLAKLFSLQFFKNRGQNGSSTD
jgi:hypothetical protein